MTRPRTTHVQRVFLSCPDAIAGHFRFFYYVPSSWRSYADGNNATADSTKSITQYNKGLLFFLKVNKSAIWNLPAVLLMMNNKCEFIFCPLLCWNPCQKSRIRWEIRWLLQCPARYQIHLMMQMFIYCRYIRQLDGLLLTWSSIRLADPSTSRHMILHGSLTESPSAGRIMPVRVMESTKHCETNVWRKLNNPMNNKFNDGNLRWSPKPWGRARLTPTMTINRTIKLVRICIIETGKIQAQFLFKVVSQFSSYCLHCEVSSSKDW